MIEYVWNWSKRPADRNRKGQRCRVLARGTMNSALVEFSDGVKHIVSRNGLRKEKKNTQESIAVVETAKKPKNPAEGKE